MKNEKDGMTNEEAIKWVDDRMCWGRGTFTKNHRPNIDECWEAGCMAIKALREREWIPVSERLPEHTSHCIVSSNDTTWVALWSDEKWISVGHFGVELHDVTAWQPLPDPYKGGDTE